MTRLYRCPQLSDLSGGDGKGGCGQKARASPMGGAVWRSVGGSGVCVGRGGVGVGGYPARKEKRFSHPLQRSVLPCPFLLES